VCPFLMSDISTPPRSTFFPYTTLFRSSDGPNWAQPGGRHVFWAAAALLAPHRSTAGYARRSRLASAQNPLPRTTSISRSGSVRRSEEHTSELQSRFDLVCRLLLEKKKV